ncbi:MAG: PH domain-containing protein [Mediterraneibacter sp.]
MQGITGSKKDFTYLPYSRVQAFSIETAGTLDMDAELPLCCSGLGSVKFDFFCWRRNKNYWKDYIILHSVDIKSAPAGRICAGAD